MANYFEIEGIAYPVVDGSQSMATVVRGEIVRSFDLTLRVTEDLEAYAWQLTVGPLSLAAFDTLKALCVPATFVDMTGDITGSAGTIEVSLKVLGIGHRYEDGVIAYFLSLGINETAAH